MNRMLPSPTSRSLDGLPFHTSPSTSDFQIERGPKQYPTISRRVAPRGDESNYDEEYALRESVSKFLLGKARPFAVSGLIPFDPSNLVLFFRSKSGITHSLDFPIDVEYDTPPALDVLIAACRPHQSSDRDDLPDRESLFYPPNLPLTATVEMSNHPIMEAVRNTLFPSLPVGHYLIAVRDKLEVIVGGGRMGHQPRALSDNRIATIHVTLPVRYRGGTLVIRHPEGGEETFSGRGGKSGDLEWTAFLPDCDYEVETVQKGCRMSISYAVFARTFGPSGALPDPLINPSNDFLELLSPILYMMRGHKIAFYLVNDYGVNPSEVLAESLVPLLKGGDSLLYHAVKFYKLTPELHWTAGGYIWPVDRTVECGPENPDVESIMRPHFGVVKTPRQPALRGSFSTYTGEEVEEADKLRYRVEDSGAIPLAEADINILADWNAPGPVGKERVPLVTGGELEKLVVNVLLLCYVP